MALVGSSNPSIQSARISRRISQKYTVPVCLISSYFHDTKRHFPLNLTRCFSRNSGHWLTVGPLRRTRVRSQRTATLRVDANLKALIFDCDGVILESEDLHRRAYNATWEHFNVQCPGQEGIVHWDETFYDMLQNKVGGGKPKMRWYFGENGWPTSTIFETPPSTDEEKSSLIDQLQDWKTAKYQQMISGGEVEPREGILQLMDSARAAGLKVGVCSAATKSSVITVLESLLGLKRFNELDVFLAGDDVPNKKPDPKIYQIAAEKLGLDPADCLVVEDSSIGLQAALGAGMRCMITYTPSTRSQDFPGAERVLGSLGGPGPALEVTDLLVKAPSRLDDRISVTTAA